MRYAYPAVLQQDTDGVTVTFPDLPEAIACGSIEAEAISRSSQRPELCHQAHDVARRRAPHCDQQAQKSGGALEIFSHRRVFSLDDVPIRLPTRDR
jgi:hypothetical protein